MLSCWPADAPPLQWSNNPATTDSWVGIAWDGATRLWAVGVEPFYAEAAERRTVILPTLSHRFSDIARVSTQYSERSHDDLPDSLAAAVDRVQPVAPLFLGSSTPAVVMLADQVSLGLQYDDGEISVVATVQHGHWILVTTPARRATSAWALHPHPGMESTG